jgi:predicted RNA-binding Zn-ribbon protein involved in translation (DUF1610 family)
MNIGLIVNPMQAFEPVYLRSFIMEQYGCKTCGKVTIGKENLCDPEPVSTVYECSRCGDHFSKPENVVDAKPVELKFYCDSCGRGALSDNEVCKPVKL